MNCKKGKMPKDTQIHLKTFKMIKSFVKKLYKANSTKFRINFQIRNLSMNGIQFKKTFL